MDRACSVRICEDYQETMPNNCRLHLHPENHCPSFSAEIRKGECAWVRCPNRGECIFRRRESEDVAIKKELKEIREGGG